MKAVACLLSLLAVAAPVHAQGPIPCPGGLTTRLEANLGFGGWFCPEGGPASTATALRLRTTATKGTWCTVLMRTYIRGPGNLAQSLRSTWPWLGEPTPVDPGLLFAGWAGQPDITMNLELFWFMLFNGIVSAGTGVLDENAVKDWYVPILEDGSPNSLGTRVWDSRPDAWTLDLNGTGIGPAYSAIWDGMLEDQYGTPSDTMTLNVDAVMRFAVLLQAPSYAEAKGFLDSGDLTLAASAGLLAVEFQAVAMIGTGPGLTPGTSDAGAPGLVGHPTYLPDASISNPITVLVSIAAPSGCIGCGGAGGSVTASARRYFLADHLWPAAFLQFTSNTLGSSLPPTRIHAAPTLLRPLRHYVDFPAGIGVGPISLITPFTPIALPYGNVTSTQP